MKRGRGLYYDSNLNKSIYSLFYTWWSVALTQYIFLVRLQTVKFISNSRHVYCMKIHILINNLTIGVLQGLKFVINNVCQYLYSN